MTKIAIDYTPPEGYYLVGYGPPREGEYLDFHGRAIQAPIDYTIQRHFILRQILPWKWPDWYNHGEYLWWRGGWLTSSFQPLWNNGKWVTPQEYKHRLNAVINIVSGDVDQDWLPTDKDQLYRRMNDENS